MTKRRLTLLVMAAGSIAILALLAGCRSTDVYTTIPPTTTATAAAPAPAAAPTVDVAPEGVIEITGDDTMSFAPAAINAEPGTYTVAFTNNGLIRHDIQFADGTGAFADPGETVEFEVAIPAGGIEFVCSVPGHADAGMVGRVTTPGTPAAASAPSEGHEVSAAFDEVEPDPNAPPYELYDPRLPARGEGEGVTLIEGGAADGGDLIEVELVIEEKLMTVAEGYVQKVWTFGGTVPGPAIHTRVGDTVRVRLINPAESEVSHSIDFHASQVAWNDEMRSIAPGEEIIYEFTTDYAGIWMYHCGTAPVLHHIANGMFGAVVVEPAGGLEPLDNEFVLVQNEWYLGPQGGISSLAKADQGAPSPDLMMFNGVAFQYLDNPIPVPTGEEIRLWVLNVGPSMDSSFHIVGTIFDTVVKEGIALTRGNDGNWGSQAVDLAPAQGAMIELQAVEDGLYPIVTHAFNFPGRGALGLLQAGDGDPLNDPGRTDSGTISTTEGAPQAAAAPPPAGSFDREIEVVMTEFAFSPSEIEVTAGETVRFVVHNEGAVQHELRLAATHSVEDHLAGGHEGGHEGEEEDPLVLVDPGQTATLDVTFTQDMDLEVIACLIPGHYEAGMFGSLTISS